MDGETWRAKLFDSTEMDVEDGDVLTIDQGEIINHKKCAE